MPIVLAATEPLFRVVLPINELSLFSSTGPASGW